MRKLKVGEPAPDFELQDEAGTMWSLGSLSGQKVIVFFYPADDTPGCTREACDFRDHYDRLRDAGYEVLGVSDQGAESHRAFKSKFSLKYPLLIDEFGEMARAYGVWTNHGDYHGVPLHVSRSTFVIDEKGTLVDARYGVRSKGHVEELTQTLGV